MNVLVLNGSPKVMGNTYRLTDAFISALPRDYKVKRYDLFELKPIPCNACGYCKVADGCSKKDLDEFIGFYNEADVIVVATPVYNLSMPAPMKALFDRFQRYYEARFRRKIANAVEKPKTAVLIVTSGGDGRIGFEIIKRQVEQSFSVMNTKITASMLAEHTDENRVSETQLEQAKSLVKYI